MRAIDGLTRKNVSVAHTYVANITSPAERGRVFGLMSTIFGIGFILGPIINTLGGNVSLHVSCQPAHPLRV